MEEDRIGRVLARASELRSKMTNCIHSASVSDKTKSEDKESAAAQEEEDDEAIECLLNIRDALESLEAQLSSLQALQQQQWYEKEAAFAEIEYSQKKLLKKLKEYKGENLEVIHEAIAFAGETVEDNNDLLLPPYPSRPSFPSAHKFSQNGVMSSGVKHETKALHESEQKQRPSQSKSPFKGVRFLVSEAAKIAITIVGIVSVLSLAGFEPSLRKRDNQPRVFGSFQLHGNEDKGTTNECPPGKVAVIENGEIRCLVKERVEVPFESIIATPNVNYGCG